MAAPPTITRLDASLFPKEQQKAGEEISKFFTEAGACLDKGLTFQENFKAQVTAQLKARGAPFWLSPSYTNSWVDFSGPLAGRYRKNGEGLVQLAGSLKSGTIGSTAFTLPAGYRPTQEVDISPWSSGETDSKLVILASGAVVPVTGSNTQFSIDCSFMGDGTPGPTLTQDLLFACTVGRPLEVRAISAVTAADGNTTLAVGPCAWRYQQDGQVRVTSVPGLLPDTDYLVTFLAVGS